MLLRSDAPLSLKSCISCCIFPNSTVFSSSPIGFHKKWIELLNPYIKNQRKTNDIKSLPDLEKEMIDLFLGDNKSEKLALIGLRGGFYPISLIKAGFSAKDVFISLCKDSAPSNTNDEFWNEHPRWSEPFRIFRFLRSSQLYVFIELCLQSGYEIEDLFDSYSLSDLQFSSNQRNPIFYE